MIDIVFTIVVTIGKIIGIFLLILLAVLLAILFVPFRYDISAEKYNRPSEADADTAKEVQSCKIVCSWLMHLVHVRILLDRKQTQGEKTRVECYLFGIPVFALRHKITQMRQNLKKKNKKDSHVCEADQMAGMQEEAEEDAAAAVPKAEKRKPKESKRDVKISAKTSARTEAKAKKRLWKSPLKGIWNKIAGTIKGIWEKILGIAHKIGEGGRFLRQDTTKAALRMLFDKGKRIVLHLLPRRIRGKLVFGFSDPALTGEVLGLVSLFYLRYQREFTLIPVFEYPVLEGKVRMRGRIYLSYLIWQVVSLLRDQDVRKAWKDIRCLAKEK